MLRELSRSVFLRALGLMVFDFQDAVVLSTAGHCGADRNSRLLFKRLIVLL